MVRDDWFRDLLLFHIGALEGLMTSLQAEEERKGDHFIDDFLVVHSKFGVKSKKLRHVCSFSHETF